MGLRDTDSRLYYSTAMIRHTSKLDLLLANNLRGKSQIQTSRRTSKLRVLVVVWICAKRRIFAEDQPGSLTLHLLLSSQLWMHEKLVQPSRQDFAVAASVLLWAVPNSCPEAGSCVDRHHHLSYSA
jgi:hypothetical protein